MILEAIYEPTFHENSHGFRPGRSCHTALESLRRTWVGAKWCIELDISDCFGTIDHHRLLDILHERIQDDRFLNLIRKFLRAGYLEQWVYHRTYSGTPQGSVISPILTNIYMAKLDAKLEDLSEQHHQGKTRPRNPVQRSLVYQRQKLLRQGSTDPSRRPNLQRALRELNRQLLATPSFDFHDPHYTRVKFLRYADDTIVGIIGPKQLAQELIEELARFLKEDLKLELNREKTHLTHLPTQKAHFLGYQFKTSPSRLRRRPLKQKGSPFKAVQTVKTGTGHIQLLVPLRDLTPKLKPYMVEGQPASRSGLINQPVEHILEHYNALLRGWYQYYQLAENVSRLNYAKYVLQYSLAKTLAEKERLTAGGIFRKYGRDLTFHKANGREVHFFNQPLTQVKRAYLTDAQVDQRPHWGPRRTQTRLLDHCAICASGDHVEMHHVRHIRKHGEHIQGFTLYLAAINRKQIPVCRRCHQDIHRGKYDGADLSQVLEQIQAPQSGT